MCVVAQVNGEQQGSLSEAVQDAIRKFVESWNSEGDAELAWWLSFGKLPGVRESLLS